MVVKESLTETEGIGSHNRARASSSIMQIVGSIYPLAANCNSMNCNSLRGLHYTKKRE